MTWKRCPTMVSSLLIHCTHLNLILSYFSQSRSIGPISTLTRSSSHLPRFVLVNIDHITPTLPQADRGHLWWSQGEVVEYTLNITSNGYSASYVTGPGGRPVMGAEFTIVQARSVCFFRVLEHSIITADVLMNVVDAHSRQTSYKLFKAGALPVKTYRSKWDGVPCALSCFHLQHLNLTHTSSSSY